MTAQELARLLNAKRIGKDTWLAHCAAHPDRHPSLTIKVGRKVPIVLKCQSAGCSAEDICVALGIPLKALFYDDAITPIVRVQMTLERQREVLTEAWLSARCLMGLEKRKYWQTVALNAYADLQRVRCRLEPMEVYREWRGRVWASWTDEQRERYLDGVYYREILPRYGPVRRV